jgi:MraZ protein
MSKFRGTFPHTIDAKGRLSVPTRFRDVLKAKDDTRLVVTRGTRTECLSVFPMDRWYEVEEDIDNLPASDDKDDFVRHFISPAQDCQVDKMGRILIPAQLREEAGLDREVMVVGALSKFEVWDKARWDEYNNETRGNALQLLKTQSIRF